ncbi:hypothetical protein PFISCL1PPCAC_7822, partial [Pristionchus fissidentatus]
QTLALHSLLFRDWFISDRTRAGPKKEPHHYNGVGLREMTRFLSIVATDTVEDVDEQLLEAVYHLQARHAQCICEEWIMKRMAEEGETPTDFITMMFKVRAKYGKLDNIFAVSQKKWLHDICRRKYMYDRGWIIFLKFEVYL